MRSLLYLLLVFLLFFEQGFSVPIPSPPPVVHKPGDFVGVRPAAYEEKSKENVGTILFTSRVSFEHIFCRRKSASIRGL